MIADRGDKDVTLKTVPEWSGVLAGVDIFTLSHCFTAMESLRID